VPKFLPVAFLASLLTLLGVQAMTSAEPDPQGPASIQAAAEPAPSEQVAAPIQQEPAAPVADDATTVHVELNYGSEGRWPTGRDVPWTEGMTVLDALMEIAEVRFYGDDPTHPGAVEAIDGVRAKPAESRFWMFDVNGEHPQVMAQDLVLAAGDEVVWSYMVPPVTVRIDFGPVERAPMEVQVDFRPGMTVLDALQEATRVTLTEDDPLHPKAVAAIDGVGTDLERGWFWLYDVNGRHPAFMADRFFLKGGFEVDWRLSAPEDRPADDAASADQADHDAAQAGQPVAPAQRRGLSGLSGL
jgi:hypothetical protein